MTLGHDITNSQYIVNRAEGGFALLRGHRLKTKSKQWEEGGKNWIHAVGTSQGTENKEVSRWLPTSKSSPIAMKTETQVKTLIQPPKKEAHCLHRFNV